MRKVFKDCSSVPVSYTHLDVYKRQVYINAVDINMYNRVVDVNFATCKIVLNNFVKNTKIVSLLHKEMKKTDRLTDDLNCFY